MDLAIEPVNVKAFFCAITPAKRKNAQPFDRALCSAG